MLAAAAAAAATLSIPNRLGLLPTFFMTSRV